MPNSDTGCKKSKHGDCIGRRIHGGKYTSGTSADDVWNKKLANFFFKYGLLSLYLYVNKPSKSPLFRYNIKDLPSLGVSFVTVKVNLP